MTETKTKVRCPRFNNCEAPLCPLAANLNAQIWYPDEPICRAAKFQTLGWIKGQKRVLKVNVPLDKYFTVSMLERVWKIQRGIEGLDPDQPLAEARKAEEKWVLAHRKRAESHS